MFKYHIIHSKLFFRWKLVVISDLICIPMLITVVSVCVISKVDIKKKIIVSKLEYKYMVGTKKWIFFHKFNYRRKMAFKKKRIFQGTKEKRICLPKHSHLIQVKFLQDLRMVEKNSSVFLSSN